MKIILPAILFSARYRLRLRQRGTLRFILPLLFCVTSLFAQKGKDGSKTITGSNAILNEYTSLSANVTAGNTFIKVIASNLNTNNRFSGPLSGGDLIMIIQMQGASIKSSSTDSSWGTITNYNNSGLYEFAEVASIPDANTINLSCALINNYTSTGKVQVVRIPRLSSLTINSGAVVTCDAWDGTKGGIVVTEVQNNTVINTGGMIDASGKGFRGGLAVNGTSAPYINKNYVYTAQNGGQKGESIAGYQADYTSLGGMYGRGAPANGGGGGNSWDCSGGGGANAGNLAAYTGNGTPDTSTNSAYIAAWNLEYPGFANSVSSGGGRGGYSPGEISGVDPLVFGPDVKQWDYNFYRSNTGGKGGRPLDYSTGRIFFGGGGGGCHMDNNNGGAGGAGGGIVYLLSYGTVSGGGIIQSNGAKGGDDNSTNRSGDGSGGGGGGGAVLLYSTGSISGVSVNANGGIGGSQFIGTQIESEGPGGGGGGGYIALSNSGVNTQALGGMNGTTNSVLLVKFPPDGGTKGGVGLPNEILTGIPTATIVVNTSADTAICSGGVVPLSASGGATYLWSPSDSLSCDTCANAIATPTATTTYKVTVSSGACSGTDSVTITVLGNSGRSGVLSGNDTICQFNNDTLYLSGNIGPVQWQTSADGLSYSDISFTDTINYLTSLQQTTYYRVYAGTGVCGDTSAAVVVVVNAVPVPPALSADDTLICASDTAHICVSGQFSSYLWNTGSTISCTPATDAGGYWLTVTDANGCSAVSGHQSVRVLPVPSVSLIVQGDTLASLDALAYQWIYNDTIITGANNNVYIAPLSGDYSVAVIDSDGCTAVSNKTHITITGLAEIPAGNGWNIYPDPFTNTIFIKSREAMEGVLNVEICDVLGRILLNNKSVERAQGPIQLDVSHLSTGVYYINIKTDKISYIQSLIKQ